MEKIINLKDLILDQLVGLHNGEEQIITALPHIIREVTSDELKGLLGHQQKIHERQVKTLNEAFSALYELKKGRVNNVIHLLLDEVKNYIERSGDPEILDTGVIMFIQEIMHYKIACYGAISSYARALHKPDLASLLHQNLDDEKEMDRDLTAIAENSINAKAKFPIVT